MKYVRFDYLVVLGMLLFMFSSAAVAQTTAPLMQASDISYIGRFALPSGGSVPATYDYGGYAMGFYKAPDGTKTLYLSGHVYGPGYFGQVQVPADSQLKPFSTSYASLVTATVLQPITDAMEGHGNIENNGSPNWATGILPYNSRLIMTAVNSYSVNNTGGHVVRDTLTLSGNGHVKPTSGVYSMTGGANQRSIAGYMFLIPTAWRALLGGPAMTGECCLSIISNTSGGPALTVFDPDQVGVTSPIPGINVLNYPTPTTPVSCATDGACQSNVFNLTSRVLGGGFVPNTRTVFFVEGHGTGPYCYGTGPECNDPVMPDEKGPHAYPYRYQLLAYDANDLIAVKNGTKQPFQVQPYNAASPWVLPQFTNYHPQGSAAAFDPETGRLYLRVEAGTNPVIDVFQISVPGSGDSVPPSPPTNLRVVSQQ